MHLRRFANSLMARLLFIGVVLVICGAVGRYFLLADYLREDLTEVVAAQQLALAQGVARDIDYRIEARRQLLERLAASLPVALLDRPGELRAWLEERHRLLPLFSLGLLVADTEGRVRMDFPQVAGRIGVSIADYPDFRSLVREAPSALIGTPLLGPLSKEPMLPMSAAVRDGDGRLRAVMIGLTALAAPGFLERVREGRIGETGSFLLISPRDRLFVTAGKPELELKATPPAGVNLLHDRAMAGFRGSGLTVNAQGVEEIAAIATVPSTGWFVVARLPTAEAFSPVERARRYIIRHAFTAAATVVVAVGLLLTWIMRPLYRAAEQAERMTQGEIPLEPLPVERDDEVGHLTAAFNRLLAKLSSSQAELERLVHHDPLTGLPNRSLLADRIEQALSRAQRNGTRVAVLFMDLDGFKQINDTLGHNAGDEALLQVAERLRKGVRHCDTLARVGGDEFVLLAADLGEKAEAGLATLAGKCIEALGAPLDLGAARRQVGVSIGIALSRGEGDAERLLHAADSAMYEAKQEGGGRYVLRPPVSQATPA